MKMQSFSWRGVWAIAGTKHDYREYYIKIRWSDNVSSGKSAVADLEGQNQKNDQE